MPPLRLPPDLRLSPEQFAQVCDANPEAVLELTADRQLGWLLFPEQQAAEIWRAPADHTSVATPERLEPATLLEEGERLPGLRLNLAELWML